MILRRLAVALALTAAMPPAWAADLLTIYRDARVSDPVYQAARAQYAATREKLPQAKRNFEVGTATIVDTLEAQARYDQSTAKAIADTNDLEVKMRALEVLIGTLPTGLVALAEPLRLAPPQPADVEAWVKAA